MADNLIQKKGESTWYVRLAVPADVQDSIGAKVLIQSLKTGLRKEAMNARLPILAAWKSRIAAAREGTPLPDGWQDDFIATLQGIDQKITKLKWAMIDDDDESGEPTDAQLEAFRRADPEIVRAILGMHQIREQQPRGEFKFADDIGQLFKIVEKAKLTSPYRISSAQEAEVDRLIADPASHKHNRPITTTRLKAFREFRESRGGSAKHIDQQVGKMERLATFLKERNLDLNFDSVDLWLKSMDRSPATLGQHLMAGTALWDWAMKYDPVWRDAFKNQASPFLKHDIPQGGGKQHSGEQRDIYTLADLAKLHASAVTAKSQPLADLILMGAYTGSRIEQLCRLKVEDVIEPDGVPSFNFLKGKSKAAVRVVPIHPALLPTIERLVRDSTDGYLIPVTTDNKYDKRSHGISKAFGYLKKRLGYGPLHVFHSMRNTVITELVRADVPDAMIKEIVGHKAESITHDIYSHGASAQQKLAAISKIRALPL